MAHGKVDRRPARQSARSPLLWSERDWRRRRRRGLVREAVLDGRKLGPERARQQRRRPIGIPRKFSEAALRARACLYVSSVQETSRCCNLPERRKRSGGDSGGGKRRVTLLRNAPRLPSVPFLLQHARPRSGPRPPAPATSKPKSTAFGVAVVDVRRRRHRFVGRPRTDCLATPLREFVRR